MRKIKNLFLLVSIFSFIFRSFADSPNISISSYPWKYRTLAEMLAEMKTCDVKKITVFDGLKIGGDSNLSESKFGWKMDESERAGLRKILSDAGVSIFSYSNMSTVNPDEINRIFEFAKAMGIELVSVEAPLSALPIYAACAKKYGIRAGLYNHGNPDSRYLTPESGLSAISVNPDLELLPDCGHWGRAKFDIVEELKKVGGKFTAINVQDINDKKGCMTYGTGILPLDDFLKELFANQKFDGTIIIMFDVSPEPMQRILPSIKFLKNAKETYKK